MEYLLNSEPIGWEDLIAAAGREGKFQDPSFRTTSEAAKILRQSGFTVEQNQEVTS